jgi:hypothetical protein
MGTRLKGAVCHRSASLSTTPTALTPDHHGVIPRPRPHAAPPISAAQRAARAHGTATVSAAGAHAANTSATASRTATHRDFGVKVCQLLLVGCPHLSELALVCCPAQLAAYVLVEGGQACRTGSEHTPGLVGVRRAEARGCKGRRCVAWCGMSRAHQHAHTPYPRRRWWPVSAAAAWPCPRRSHLWCGTGKPAQHGGAPRAVSGGGTA